MMTDLNQHIITRETIAGLVGELQFYIDKENSMIRRSNDGDDSYQIESHYLAKARNLLAKLNQEGEE